MENQTQSGAGLLSHALFALRLEGLRTRTDTAMWACALSIIAANTGNETANSVIRILAFIGMMVMWWAERKVRKLIGDLSDCHANEKLTDAGGNPAKDSRCQQSLPAKPAIAPEGAGPRSGEAAGCAPRPQVVCICGSTRRPVQGFHSSDPQRGQGEGR